MLTNFLNHIYTKLDAGAAGIFAASSFLMQWCLVVSILLSALFYTLEKQGDGMSRLIRSILAIGFMIYFYRNWSEWSYYLRDGMLRLAGPIAAYDVGRFLNPNLVWEVGRAVIGNVLANQLFNGTWTSILSRLGDCLVIAIFIVPVLGIAFLNAGVGVFLALVEWKVVMTLGTLLIPFNLVSGTEFIGQKIFPAILSSTLRLFGMYITIGIGMEFLRNTRLPPEASMGDLLDFLGVAVAFGALTKVIPDRLAGLVSGAPSISSLMKR